MEVVLSRVFFISDLHFGHRKVFTFEDGWRAKVLEGITSIEEHDEALIRRVNATVNKRDWLYILGDLGFSFEKINEFKCNKKIHLGNHDHERDLQKIANLDNTKIISCISYKRHWLSHIPIHPQEIRNRLLNIHGHNHSNSVPDERYVNVSVDITCGWPIPFEMIRDGQFKSHDILTPEDAHWQTKELGFFDEAISTGKMNR